MRHSDPKIWRLSRNAAGSPTQLGFALILVCLRYPARVLEANEKCCCRQRCSRISRSSST